MTLADALLQALLEARDDYLAHGVPVTIHFPSELGIEQRFVVDLSRRGEDA